MNALMDIHEKTLAFRCGLGRFDQAIFDMEVLSDIVEWTAAGSTYQ
jgi:hypothetical protein